MMRVIRTHRTPYVSVTTEAVPGAMGIDAYRVGYLGASHFLDQGIQRIGLMVSREPGRFHARVTERFHAAMEERNTPEEMAPLCFANETSEAAGYAAFKRWWGRGKRSDSPFVRRTCKASWQPS